jgi:hypothetical protein
VRTHEELAQAAGQVASRLTRLTEAQKKEIAERGDIDKSSLVGAAMMTGMIAAICWAAGVEDAATQHFRNALDGTLVESLHRRFLKDGDKLWKD